MARRGVVGHLGGPGCRRGLELGQPPPEEMADGLSPLLPSPRKPRCRGGRLGDCMGYRARGPGDDATCDGAWELSATRYLLGTPSQIMVPGRGRDCGPKEGLAIRGPDLRWGLAEGFQALVVHGAVRSGSPPQKPRKHGGEAKKTHLSSTTRCPSPTRKSWTTSRSSSEPTRRGGGGRRLF